MSTAVRELTAPPKHEATAREAVVAAVRAQDERARLLRAGVFWAGMMTILAGLALSPMFVSRDWKALMAMAPLALAAGICFGGILALNLFLDSDEH